MELAVAGQADYMITRNVRDLRAGEFGATYLLCGQPNFTDSR
jgi:hypothetical protein